MANWQLWAHKSTDTLVSRSALLVAFVVVLVSLLGVGEVAAQTEDAPTDDSFSARTIEFVPVGDSITRWKGEQYPGIVSVDARSGGLLIRNEVEPETYLIGIREVPTEWPIESLKAQAVAARTYLAWTLSRGRAGSGAAYGFDICATTACQVYLGGGDQRWAEAVAATRGEILSYEGAPAQALYSSTSGGRTRTVGDVFVGSSNLPYLQAVPSDDEASPFVEWSYAVPHDQLEEILRRAGLSGDVLFSIGVNKTLDGAGPWNVEVISSAGRRTMDTWTFRTVMNRWAERLFPDDFPALRPDGRRYPQVVLSPSFSIRRQAVIEHAVADAPPYRIEFVFTGNGWGHLVGMSQFGAKARADAGETYDRILSHYYTGLTPSSTELPESVLVGLGWDVDTVTLITEPMNVFVDGQLAALDVAGAWTLVHGDGLIRVTPPPGWQVPSALADVAVPVASGVSVVVIEGFVRRPADIRVVVYRGDEVVFKSVWRTVAPGSVRLFWAPDRNGPFRVVGQVRYADGTSDVLRSAFGAW